MTENRDTLRLGLPSKGSLAEGALDFLNRAGLKVHKPNARQYIAKIPSLPGVEVILQRPTDIFHKVQDGTLDLGVTGLDIYHEYTDTSDDTLVVQKLGFGGASLVVAVPESWLDVASVGDLADLAVLYKERGRKLRIATTFHNLTRNWLFAKGITNFSIVNADGALEVAPSMGYADLIADLTATGTTLRENRLKILDGGIILDSEATLIANGRQLSQNPEKLRLTRYILEFMEASLRARKYVSLLANIRGESVEQIGGLLNQEPSLSGLVGPSVVQVHPKSKHADGWFEVHLVIERAKLFETMEHLRTMSGTDITVTYPQYVFSDTSETFNTLKQQLGL